MPFDVSLMVMLLGRLLGDLPWTLGCLIGLVIVIVWRAQLGRTAPLAITGFAMLLGTSLLVAMVSTWLGSSLMAATYLLTPSEQAKWLGVTGLLSSLVECAALVLIALAVVSGRAAPATMDNSGGTVRG